MQSKYAERAYMEDIDLCITYAVHTHSQILRLIFITKQEAWM